MSDYEALAAGLLMAVPHVQKDVASRFTEAATALRQQGAELERLRKALREIDACYECESYAIAKAALAPQETP